MKLLRYLLIAASIIPAVALIFAMKMEARTIGGQELALVTGAVILLFANAYYLVEHPPYGDRPNGRIRRFFSLWLAAKESELQQRAGKATPPAG